MQAITPFLWFNDEAVAAARFYVSVFKKNSKILETTYYPKHAPRKAGSVMTVRFRIRGQEFVALNGDTQFKFSLATSFVVNCRTQKEVDYYWRKLGAGGKDIQCGWLTDKFGVAWQITPTVLLELIASKDRRKVDRVVGAMMKMVKLDIKTLQQAAVAK
jgi:predicted 3-demethylubiquinone-9 3-methyltransferase (glyoxalase superfamily)